MLRLLCQIQYYARLGFSLLNSEDLNILMEIDEIISFYRAQRLEQRRELK